MPVEGPQYPVNLIVAGRRCLVVGGGRVALHKVRGLLSCEADVTVIAPRIEESLKALNVSIRERPYREGDMNGYRLVITATNDADLNRAIFLEGERSGIWVNAADEPSSCSFTIPSVVRRGSLMLTISTGGHSPALSTWLKEQLAGDIGPEYVGLLALLSAERTRIKAEGRPTEGLNWRPALDDGLLDLVRKGRLDEARQRLRHHLDRSSDTADPPPA